MTIFFGTLLSFTRMQLGPIQKVQVEIDTKKKILGAVMEISSLTPEEILSLYDKVFGVCAVLHSLEILKIVLFILFELSARSPSIGRRSMTDAPQQVRTRSAHRGSETRREILRPRSSSARVSWSARGRS